MSEILQFVERYIAARDISPGYTHNLRKRAEKIAEFVGSTDITQIFTEATVNDFLASLTDLNVFTVQSYRSDICSLWNAAADLDFVEYPVMRRIRRPKSPALIVDCFSVEEVQAILAAARTCHPYLARSGFNRRLYWAAIIQLAWDTGLRRGDCWTFRKKWIRPDGTARVVQHKTKKIVTVRLRPSTIADLEAIPYDQCCRWPGGLGHSSRFSRQFREIAKSAGVMRGQFKWLRRASGSYVEVVQPGAGGKHLGHASGNVFQKHYDAQLGAHLAPQPPSLAPPPKDSRPAGETGDEFLFL